jgi:hypothetical protein
VSFFDLKLVKLELYDHMKVNDDPFQNIRTSICGKDTYCCDHTRTFPSRRASNISPSAPISAQN